MSNNFSLILSAVFIGLSPINFIHAEKAVQLDFSESELKEFDSSQKPNDIVDLVKEQDLIKAIEVNKKYSHNRGYTKDYELLNLNMQQREYFESRYCYLVGKLIKNYPESNTIPEYIEERWRVANKVRSFDYKSEIEWFSNRYPEKKDIVKKGWFYESQYNVRMKAYRQPDDALAIIDSFEASYPGDELNVELILDAHRYFYKRDDIKDKLMKHLETNYSDHKKVKTQIARNKSREESRKKMAQNTGKEFKLKFKDVLTEREIDLESYKGKVVVVDFWATWCGPCVAEIPKLKEVYAKYKDQGVEVIGISFDSQKDTLVNYCTNNKMPWPQYFDGLAWSSKVGKEWGVSSIPRVFILDQQGKVYNVEGRSQMETLILELLAKK